VNGPQKVRLGQVLRHRKEFIHIDDLATYKRCRVQLHARGVVLRDLVSGAEVKTKAQQLCRAGELLVAEIDAKVGGYGLVPPDLDGAIVSSHYFLFEVDTSALDPHYLRYFLQTAGFRDQVIAQGSTNYAAIRPDHVLSYEIPLPPMREQRRIVARIESLTTRIEEAQQLRARATHQVEALVASTHMGASGQRVVPLEQVLELHERQEQILRDTAYPQVGLKAYGQGLFAKEAVNGAETTYRTFNRLYEGAVVLSQVKGWEGAMAVCPASLSGWYVSPEYRTFRCRPGLAVSDYFAVLVAAPWFWLKLRTLTRGVGGRRERTRPEAFLGLELPMPLADQQERLLPVFQRVEALRRIHSQVADELDALIMPIVEKTFSRAL